MKEIKLILTLKTGKHIDDEKLISDLASILKEYEDYYLHGYDIKVVE